MSTVNDPGHFGSIIRFNPAASSNIPNNGTIHMGATFFSNTWLQKSDGGLFDLISLELGGYSRLVTPPSPLNISVITVYGSILSTNLFIDGIFDGPGGGNDFQLYTLNWRDIVRLDFNGVGFSFDNINIAESIPVPGSIYLVAFGVFLWYRKKPLHSSVLAASFNKLLNSSGAKIAPPGYLSR